MNEKRIIILLTVPIDLEREGYEIGAYASQLNSIYAPYGIVIEILIIDEGDSDPLFGEERIDESDYFYVLMYRHSDERAICLFNHAYENFVEREHPKIFTYFRRVPPEITIEQGLRDFMRILDDEIGHYHSIFSSVDSIKLDMILELASDTETTSSLDVRKGVLCNGDEKVLDLGNIPAYSHNAKLQELRRRKRELERLSRELLSRSLDSDDSSVDEQIAETLQKRKKVIDEIDQVERDTLNVAIQLLSHTSSDGTMNKRILNAREQFSQGNIDAALAILQDDEIERERELRWEREQAIQHEHEKNREEEQAFVNGRLLLINLIKASGKTSGSDDEIARYYAECMKSTLAFELDPTFLPTYINHLYSSRRFDEFEVISAQIVKYLSELAGQGAQDVTFTYIRAVSYRAAGIMHQGFEDPTSARRAEEILLAAYPIAKALVQQDASISARSEYSTLLSYLGLARINQFDYSGARTYLIESITIGKEVADWDPSFRKNLAIAANSVALSFYREHRCDSEAVAWAEESLAIRKQLYEEVPYRYDSFYALGLYVLGAVLRRSGDLAGAEAQFLESIALLKELSVSMPDRCGSLLASAEGGYSKALMRQGRYDEAVSVLRDACAIRSRLNERYPETYGRPLLFVLNRLALALENSGITLEASAIRRQAKELELITHNQAALPDSD